MSKVLVVRPPGARARRRHLVETATVTVAGIVFIVVVALLLDGGPVRGAVMAAALVCYLIGLLVALGRARRAAAKDEPYVLRLDDDGVQLRPRGGDVPRTDLGWNDIGLVLLAHIASPAVNGALGMVFLPRRDAETGTLDLVSGEARSRTWVSSPAQRDDVRRVLAYLAEHRPDVPVREATFPAS